jgi:hypothetical protein
MTIVIAIRNFRTARSLSYKSFISDRITRLLNKTQHSLQESLSHLKIIYLPIKNAKYRMLNRLFHSFASIAELLSVYNSDHFFKAGTDKVHSNYSQDRRTGRLSGCSVVRRNHIQRLAACCG